MEKKDLICIGCPLGCALSVELEDGEVKNVTGYTCSKGKQYAMKEVTNPTRIVTSSVMVMNGNHPVVPVKTSGDIPKDKIKECIFALKGITVIAPIKIGDVILENVAKTNINIIATKNIMSLL